MVVEEETRAEDEASGGGGGGGGHEYVAFVGIATNNAYVPDLSLISTPSPTPGSPLMHQCVVRASPPCSRL